MPVLEPDLNAYAAPRALAEPSAGEKAPSVPAGNGARIVAKLIDGVLHVAFFAIVVLAVGAIGGFSDTLRDAPGVIGAVLVGYFAPFFAQSLVVAERGGTVGKLVMRLCIVRASDGGRCGFGRAIWRELGFVCVAAVVIGAVGRIAEDTDAVRAALALLFLVDASLVVVRHDRRHVPDFLSGTKVVSQPS